MKLIIHVQLLFIFLMNFVMYKLRQKIFLQKLSHPQKNSLKKYIFKAGDQKKKIWEKSQIAFTSFPAC